MQDWGNAAGWYDVIGQFNRPRIVVHLCQIKVIRTLVESVCVETLLDRRRRNVVVSRDPSFSVSWTGERLDVTVRVLLSRVAGIASGSPGTLLLSEPTVLPVSSLSAPPSARFLGVDGFPWTIDETIGGMLGRAVLVSEDDACLG